MQNVSIDGKNILVNGKAVTFRSGAMHYFRIHPDYWEDRIIKLKQCGLNTLETYVPWNWHEVRRGEIDFSSDWCNLEKYVRLAQKHGLYVIVRPGPFICSEWEFGGFPAWLLADPQLRLRCSEPRYLAELDRYFAVLLPILRELQWDNGGPVVMMQIENEYGGIGNDHLYLKHLYDLFLDAGIKVPLFISDWGSANQQLPGSIPETLLTVNCPSHPTAYLDAVQKIRPGTPEFVMELWSGVSHRWDELYLKHNVSDVADDVEAMLKRGNSFNFYMFHGGTSFGFMPGMRPDGKASHPYINSYDVDAPLDETGNPTPKYYMIRDLIRKYVPEAETGEPEVRPLKSFPAIQFTESAKLFDNLENLAKGVDSVTPEPMEYYGQNYGFILYRGLADLPGPATLSLENLADKAWVYLNGECYGFSETNRPVGITVPPGNLDVLVENQGRCNCNWGNTLRWNKGVTSIRLGSCRLFHWQVYSLELDNLDALKFKPYEPNPQGPCFHRAKFTIDKPEDTSIRIPYGMHGQVFLNGFNLGRYRAAGCQFSLYVPAPLLKEGENELIIFELEGLRENRAEFVDHIDHAPSCSMIR